ncbi:MAG: 30S ribosomal protein S12 methylthiotransferase RimO [Clostridia bacterium]|nr:30S ribosomal protein S12 methylthiotransferase RimO [Clostridia bacterium]
MSLTKKVGVISLGCDKNRVDTEKMLAILSEKYQLTSTITDAEIVVVNTCAFLQSARQEAVEEILQVFELKKSGKLEKIIVTGCLPQKFVGEMFGDFIEVDAFLGIADYSKILEVIDSVYLGKRVNAVGETKNEDLINRILTTDNYAYLKIADGCFNRCTYCLIPHIRGKFRSIEKEKLLDEVKSLGEIAELIIVAQDTLKYGVDLYDNYGIVELLQDITALDSVKSVRLLYCYPENITDKLIEEIKVNDKIIKYLDIPMQHADGYILKRMARRGNKETYLNLLKKLRDNIPNISLRSTFITGFPGETDEHFNALLDFLKSAQLDNAGFFKYSREEGTPAYSFDNQVPAVIKDRRVRKLYSEQKKISRKKLSSLKNSTINVLAEGFDEDKLCYVGRAYFQAPSVDGVVYFCSETEVEYGKTVDVLITDTNAYDLFGNRV